MGNQPQGRHLQSQHKQTQSEIKERRSSIIDKKGLSSLIQQHNHNRGSLRQQQKLYQYNSPPKQIVQSMVGNMRSVSPLSVSNHTPKRNSYGSSYQKPLSNLTQNKATIQKVTSSKFIPPPPEVPTARIMTSPQTKHSILKKDNLIKNNKLFKIQEKTATIDALRVQLRKIIKQIDEKLLLQFDVDITKMNEAIDLQRQNKLKDKTKVLFLLKQRKHYDSLCKKFQDYSSKIQTTLLQWRKKDCVQNINQQQIDHAKQILSVVNPLLKKIEADLPQKGWVILLAQPNSQLYNQVVQSANADQEIVKKYLELEQSLTNPTIFNSIVQEQMMHSTTRRIGQHSHKNIQGPSGEYSVS